MVRIIIADSDASFVKALNSHLSELRDLQVESVRSTGELLERLREEGIDLVFLASELKDAMPAVEQIKRARPETEVVLTAVASKMEAAVRAMKLGASDYLVKPLRPEQVAVAIERARRVRRLAEENRQLRAQPAERWSLSRLIGTTADMQRVHEQIARAAAADGPVMFVGEPGTGKELAARAVHQESARRERPFVCVACRGTPPDELQAQLLGGAGRPGAVEQAAGGIVFLAEAADLPGPLQAPVLRAIAERVGPGPSAAQVDARVLAATSRNLLECVGRGTFRQDLFERLSAHMIALPALRERMDDIPLLADVFLRRRAADGRRAPRGVSAEALATLLAYDWPGNLDELEQAVNRACELGDGDVLERRHLPPTVIQAAEVRRRTGAVDITTRSLREMESEVIEKLLAQHGGNTEAVSKLLKIDRSTLYRKIKRYQIPLDDLKE